MMMTKCMACEWLCGTEAHASIKLLSAWNSVLQKYFLHKFQLKSREGGGGICVCLWLCVFMCACLLICMYTLYP